MGFICGFSVVGGMMDVDFVVCNRTPEMDLGISSAISLDFTFPREIYEVLSFVSEEALGFADLIYYIAVLGLLVWL